MELRMPRSVGLRVVIGLLMFNVVSFSNFIKLSKGLLIIFGNGELTNYVISYTHHIYIFIQLTTTSRIK